ncbi:MAG: MBL fold metallo-hydrolase [Lachnospiraceae bacterium]|nr:MBL fold metallo-hydrolase [Lachnospiraceae bacterium]
MSAREESMLKVYSCTVGPIYTNCYIVADKKTGECIIIDPGYDENRIAGVVNQQGFKPVAIFITHGHFDHIQASNEIRARYGIKIYAPEGDKKYLTNANYNMSYDFLRERYEVNADVYLKDDEIIEMLGQKIKCIETPGHTPGGMCFYFEAENLLFAGDTLFYQSHGRTDFIGGSERDLIASIKNKLFILPDNTIVYPGHDSETSIGFEKKFNIVNMY